MHQALGVICASSRQTEVCASWCIDNKVTHCDRQSTRKEEAQTFCRKKKDVSKTNSHRRLRKIESKKCYWQQLFWFYQKRYSNNITTTVKVATYLCVRLCLLKFIFRIHQRKGERDGPERLNAKPTDAGNKTLRSILLGISSPLPLSRSMFLLSGLVETHKNAVMYMYFIHTQILYRQPASHILSVHWHFMLFSYFHLQPPPPFQLCHETPFLIFHFLRKAPTKIQSSM